jgi:hypothetical protein
MDYTATIERNLLSGEWVIRVRYASGSVGTRRRFSSFVLVPQHQGQMFSEACDSIEPAIELHKQKGGAAVRPGYSRV